MPFLSARLRQTPFCLFFLCLVFLVDTIEHFSCNIQSAVAVKHYASKALSEDILIIIVCLIFLKEL